MPFSEKLMGWGCSRRTALLLVAGLFVLAGPARGAFPVDPDEMEAVAGGRNPAFIAEIERLDQLGKLDAPAKRAKRQLPGTLLAKAMPVRRGSGTPAPLCKEYAEKTLAALEEGEGPKTWHVAAFAFSLGLAGYAFWRFKHQ